MLICILVQYYLFNTNSMKLEYYFNNITISLILNQFTTNLIQLQYY